ncbi:MAG: beta galactosidase jelly roll domain-containing protein, partial [Bacteroidales bacterium]|nr:beta galactosidase jelly roll domain-containing protein [Bacteroidales bacterium]
MKKKAIPTLLSLLFLCLFAASAQEVTVSDARFCKGDDPAFREPGFDDTAWPVLSLAEDWTKQGVSNAYGYGWYRIHVVIPSSLKKGAADKVVLDLGPIDDNDETWLNGRFVGKTDGWNKHRRYLVDAKAVNWDKDNVIAVRVYNGGEPGGFFEGPARICKPVLSDFVSMSLTGEKDGCTMTLQSAVKSSGIVDMKVINPLTGETENAQMRPVRLSPKQPATLSWPAEGQREVTVTYRDDKIEGTLAASYSVPYILTPPAPASPRYNGPLVLGVRPGSP